MSLRDKLLDLFFPPRCAFCGRVEETGLCKACEKSLPRREKMLCEHSFARVAAPLFYTGTVREAVLKLKFSGGLGKLKGFSRLMAECAAEEFSGEFDCVSFVPVSAKRRRGRGYDQAERLAIELGRYWDTKPLRFLRKRHHTKAQSTIKDPAARHANVFGVYEAVDLERIRGARILLVDDVVTTGATLKECVRVLKEAGAADVLCLTLAAAEEKSARGQK